MTRRRFGPMVAAPPVTAIVAMTLLLIQPLAAAHGELVSSEPADRTTIEAPPEVVTLTFSEPVEVPFSTFKVYPLETTVAAGEAGEREWQRLSGLAGALVAEVLTLRDDSEARADRGVTTGERRRAEIELALQDGLRPGPYVLMWRVLSIDSHITQGFVTFIVTPRE